MQVTAAISLKKLVEEAELDEEMLPLLFESFMDEGPVVLAQLQEGVVSKNSEQVRAAAHKLKGIADSVKAELLRQLCKKLELIQLNGDAGNVTSTFDEINGEFVRVVKFIEEFNAGR